MKKSIETNVLQRIKEQNAKMRNKYISRTFMEDEYIRELPNGDRQTINYVKIYKFYKKLTFF
jgi:hypothetical protein